MCHFLIQRCLFADFISHDNLHRVCQSVQVPSFSANQVILQPFNYCLKPIDKTQSENFTGIQPGTDAVVPNTESCVLRTPSMSFRGAADKSAKSLDWDFLH